ncbi:hypothetical protein AS850_07695 [Frondihabitans sp. 762G35]|uniref:CU044_5270 family protein n=1 Tax=Frondihabitans sp. 762G35 TaxID=1446794 RepID=UPI000D228EFF|nr:CU044_5270 family protein [Frondihabitans sp. 762G35]ARC56960.1 hypothetical protein AS850_07695 [Frondihabitans sp. 762G35]
MNITLEPTDDRVASMRRSVLSRIAEAEPAVDTAAAVRPAARSGRRRLGLLGVGVVAIAGVLVVSNLAGAGGRQQSAVAEVLHRSALAAVATSDPVVPPGRFLRVTTTAVTSKTSGDVSYLARAQDDLFVPADRSQDWVWVRGASTPFRTFGPASAAAAAEASPGEAELLRAPAGGFYSRPSDSSEAAFAKLPRDPRALLADIHERTVGQGNSVDEAAFGFIADELTDGLAPADLRAALYEAAALIPGVTIEDGHATLDGSTGVAIGRTDPEGNTRDELIVDPDTGALVGQREVLLRAEVGLPAGTVIGWTSKTTSVVASAPAGGTVNGVFDTRGCTVTGPDEFQC